MQSLFGPFTDQGPARRGPRRGVAPARASVRPLRDPIPPSPVDKYQTVAFDGNRYSVPRAFAFQMVTVKGYVDRVVIVAEGPGRRDSRTRSLEKQTMILDPLHYLATLGRKPGALDHAPVFRDWKLPACFTDVPRRAGRTARRAGRRTAVRPGPATAGRASPDARAPRPSRHVSAQQLDSAEAVIQRTRSLAAIEAATRRGIAAAPRSARHAPGPGAAARPEPVQPAPERRTMHSRDTADQCSDLYLIGRSPCSSPRTRTVVSRDRSSSPIPVADLRERNVPMADVTIELLKTHFRQLRLPTMGREFETAGARRRRDQPDLRAVPARA